MLNADDINHCDLHSAQRVDHRHILLYNKSMVSALESVIVIIPFILFMFKMKYY